MTSPKPDDSPQLAEPTDVSVDPSDLDTEEKPATSTAEEFREEGDGMGGTGGMDAGGAG